MANRPAKQPPSRADKLVAQADARAAEAGFEIEPEEYTLDWYRVDFPSRVLIFLEREIKIRNAFHRNQLEPWKLNDAQLELHEAEMLAYEDQTREDVTEKPRRLGISTYYMGKNLAFAILEDGHHIRIVAHDPKTLRTFIKVITEMYKGLRDEIRPAKKYGTKYELEFDDPEKGVVGSRITISNVVPGHEEDGRGDTITILHLTEIPFWKGDADKAVLALVDAAKGGRITYESSAGLAGDFFHSKYLQGQRPDSNVYSHFFTWWWHPFYRVPGARFVLFAGEWYLLKKGQRLEAMDEDGMSRAKVSSYSQEEKEKELLPLQSERDCAEQVLDHLKTRGYVDAEALWHCDEVAERIQWRRNEIESKGGGNKAAIKFRTEYPENDIDPFGQTGGCIFDNAYLKIKAQFRDAEPGHEYKVMLDPSMGIEGDDPAAIEVIDCHTGEQVFEWQGYKKQDDQAFLCCQLSDKYNGAEIGIEANMGEAAILEVERLGYGHRLFKMLDPQTERDIKEGKISYIEAYSKARPGLFLTPRMKRLVINEFERAWRTGDFKCASEGMIGEARVFIKEGESMAAKSGFTDDRILAGAECWYLVQYSRVGVPGFTSSGDKNTSAQLGAY